MDSSSSGRLQWPNARYCGPNGRPRSPHSRFHLYGEREWNSRADRRDDEQSHSVGILYVTWEQRNIKAMLMIHRGYVAVAVSTAHGTYTREVETGSDDRQKNMVTFAEESLKLLRDVLVGKANL